MGGIEDLLYFSGYVALAVLAALVGLNMVIIGARLSGHRPFAERIAAVFMPVARPFRIGSIGTTARPTVRVATAHD